jgi:hypothetical protein
VQESRFARTLTEVSRRVPIRYATLLEKRKHPDFPPDHSPSGSNRYDVITIREWLRANKVAHNAKDYPEYKPDPRQQAYAERASAAAQREKFRLEVEMAEYVPRQMVNNQIDAANAVVRRELRKALEHELPPRVEMMKAAQIKAIMAVKLREIFNKLPQAIMGSNGYSDNGS